MATETPQQAKSTTLREVRGSIRSSQGISPEVFEDAIAELPEDQKDVLQYWYYHAKEFDLSLVQLGQRVGLSSSTLSRAFRGQYGAGLDGLCKTLELRKEHLCQSVSNPDFIMTSLGKQMWEVFDTARDLQIVMFVIGKMGIGKTTVGLEYKRLHNHGKTHYHRCSPSMTLGQFISSLALSMGIPSKRHDHLRLRNKIIALLAAGKRLLIIDELHELFVQKERSRGMNAVLICEFIREIFDRAACGLVLIGTKKMMDELRSERNARALAQLLDRGLEVDLPDEPTREDAIALIKHFGLKPPGQGEDEAAAIIKDIFASSGLRKLTTYLRNGARHAAMRKEPYQWRHFVAAQAHLASLTSKPKKSSK